MYAYQADLETIHPQAHGLWLYPDPSSPSHGLRRLQAFWVSSWEALSLVYSDSTMCFVLLKYFCSFLGVTFIDYGTVFWLIKYWQKLYLDVTPPPRKKKNTSTRMGRIGCTIHYGQSVSPYNHHGILKKSLNLFTSSTGIWQ